MVQLLNVNIKVGHLLTQRKAYMHVTLCFSEGGEGAGQEWEEKRTLHRQPQTDR